MCSGQKQGEQGIIIPKKVNKAPPTALPEVRSPTSQVRGNGESFPAPIVVPAAAAVPESVPALPLQASSEATLDEDMALLQSLTQKSAPRY
jgi:hypothetical protein